MRDLDDFITNIVTKEINEPEGYEQAIRNAFNKKSTKKHIFQKIITTSSILFMGCSAVFATSYIAYDKIFKEPEKIEGFYTADGNRRDITEKEKYDSITEDEAKARALEILKKYGYENESVEKIELVINPVNYKLFYKIETQNKHNIQIDAINAENYNITPYIKEDISNYRGTREELEKYVREFCNNHDIDLSGYDVLNVNKNRITDEESYIWYFYFYKQYDNIVNTYEEVSIAIVPEINKIYWIIVNKNPFENNEIVVSQEEAKKIVLETEKNIPTGFEINDVYVNLDITEMNGDAYKRIHDYEKYCEEITDNYPLENIEYYRTDYLIRKAWMVAVIYDTNSDVSPIDKCYTYFVDVTTGEIIGGKKGYHESWYKLKNNL